MNKTILAAIIATAIGSAACRKDRTCECKISATTVRVGAGAFSKTTTTTDRVTITKQRKKEFKYISNCFSTSNVTFDEGGSGAGAWNSTTTTERECDIK